MKQAAAALNWCVAEMERRYKLLSAVGVRNLAGYNQKVRDAKKSGQPLTHPFSLTPDNPEPLEPMPMIVVFIDELHRFSRPVQDAMLPAIEDGTFVLIGATTENPSFSLVSALLSRAKVYTLSRLDSEDLGRVIGRVEEHQQRPLPLDPRARSALIGMARGSICIRSCKTCPAMRNRATWGATRCKIKA
jgi:hypothetical protein